MNALKVITSASIGLTAGLALGYLTAPRSGKKTRKIITDEVDSQVKSLSKEVDKRISSAKESYNDQVDKIADNGKTTLERAKELVSVN